MSVQPFFLSLRFLHLYPENISRLSKFLTKTERSLLWKRKPCRVKPSVICNGSQKSPKSHLVITWARIASSCLLSDQHVFEETALMLICTHRFLRLYWNQCWRWAEADNLHSLFFLPSRKHMLIVPFLVAHRSFRTIYSWPLILPDY